jgi:hypothetical protein
MDKDQYITELSELLVEAANEIIEFAEEKYPELLRAKYLSYERHYQSDIAIVKSIMAKLQENLNLPPKQPKGA